MMANVPEDLLPAGIPFLCAFCCGFVYYRDIARWVSGPVVGWDVRFIMRYSRVEMPSWWSGRRKALCRIPAKDILDAVLVSLILLAMSALVLVPVVVAI